MKKIIYKIKKDLEDIRRYPKYFFSNDNLLNYDTYWSKKRKNDTPVLSSWQKERADYILKIIEKNSSVIDMGCGDGAILFYLKEKAGIKGMGVDISPKILNKAGKIGIKTIEMDINNIESLKKLPEVDYILGLEILEHMPNPEKFIYAIKNKAKNGLIFSFPNSAYYVHRLRFLFGRFPLQWIVFPGEHLRFWTIKDTRWWVNYINFNLENIIIYQGIPFFNKIIPSLFGQGIIIKIKKND
jgi:methionine biosynthesis protein MetW